MDVSFCFLRSAFNENAAIGNRNRNSVEAIRNFWLYVKSALFNIHVSKRWHLQRAKCSCLLQLKHPLNSDCFSDSDIGGYDIYYVLYHTRQMIRNMSFVNAVKYILLIGSIKIMVWTWDVYLCEIRACVLYRNSQLSWNETIISPFIL